ncbi:hypothetical protein EIP91_005469 [Steccherinum ochraceum]|uniref:Uncharacterized protein n=1 Tax=Steccherinum ochraceum TaxID=92696 RepID=A0A4R0RVK7_9APHY|nr:hypothetical protein EIP91_005469 [Steccherinum ochraceum]
MGEELAKQPRWVWHSSAGFIHHPDAKCSDCNSRQIHVSNAEALDDEFKAAVSLKRADRREIEKLRQILMERDKEISQLRAANADLTAQVAKTLERDNQRRPPVPSAPLPTPPSPVASTAGSPPSHVPMDVDRDPRSRRLSYPPPPPQAHVLDEDRITTRDPRPSASHATPNAAPERGRVASDPARHATPSGPRTPPRSNRSRSRSRYGGQRAPYPEHRGIKRDGSSHSYRDFIGSAMSKEEFSRADPDEARLLPPVYRRSHIFSVEDVVDLLDRQCYRGNLLSKTACKVLDDLYDYSENRHPRVRLPVEDYVVEHYLANRRYSNWCRAP